MAGKHECRFGRWARPIGQLKIRQCGCGQIQTWAAYLKGLKV